MLSGPPPSLSAQCAYHPQLPAAAACARCGTFACVSCQVVASDDRAYCVRCLAVPPPLASRGTRFVANFVDHAVVYGIMLAFGLLGFAVLAVGSGSRNQPSPGAIALFLLLILVGVFAGCGLQLYLQARYGQSAGKRLMKIKVVDLSGQPVSLGALIVLRNLLPIVIGAIAGPFALVDYLFIFGDQQRCLHDLFASTRVVQAE